LGRDMVKMPSIPRSLGSKPQAADNGMLDHTKSQPRPLPSTIQAKSGTLSREQKSTAKPRSASPQLELPVEAAAPLRHTRCCVVGLLTLAALRGCAVNVYTCPAGLAWTATVCDTGAVIIYLSAVGIHGIFSLMGPIAMDEGAPAAVAFIGVWECILVASIALEMALCVSAWKFYRVFRETGIYPPNASSVRVYKEVSPLEFLCEAEDVALLSDQCSACNRTPSRNTDILPYSTTIEDPKLTIDGEVLPDVLFSRI